jgi:hypothetical protein
MKPIFVTVVGSFLYGMNTPTSDKDIKGFCFPEIDEMLGLKNFEQQLWDNGVEDGPEKIEGQILEVGKYVNLCMGGNPTVIEIAWAPEKFWIHTSPVGLEITQFIRENMFSQRLFKAYSAYHHAQMRKMESMTRVGKRANEVDDYGYDRKFAGHAYRLAKQCVGVLSNHSLNPTMEGYDLEVVMQMRNGTMHRDEVVKHLERVDVEMYDAHKASSLPDTPDFDKVNKWLTNLKLRYINGEFDNQFVPFDVKKIDL